MAFDLVKEEKGFVFRFRGALTMPEVLEVDRIAWEDPDWDKHQYEIWNFLEAEVSTFTPEDALIAATIDNVSFEVTRDLMVAMIAVEKDVLKLCRVYIDATDIAPGNVRIFKTESDARAWIGQHV